MLFQQGLGRLPFAAALAAGGAVMGTLAHIVTPFSADAVFYESVLLFYPFAPRPSTAREKVSERGAAEDFEKARIAEMDLRYNRNRGLYNVGKPGVKERILRKIKKPKKRY